MLIQELKGILQNLNEIFFKHIFLKFLKTSVFENITFKIKIIIVKINIFISKSLQTLFACMYASVIPSIFKLL